MSSRLKDALLGNTAWQTGNENVALNPLLGGSFGYAANPAEWLNAQAYKPQHLIPIVLETPLIFNKMDNPKMWHGAWKLYFEKHCRVIDGLKAGLTVETAEHAFSGDGRQFEEYTNVTRERSSLSTTSTDTYGNVYQMYWDRVIRFGLMDSQTKLPMAQTLSDAPTDNLADQYSGSIAFIEPTADGKRCQRCWIGVNIFPKSNGPVEGKMDKTTALSIKELSLDFTILDFIDEGTRVFGQEILNGINKYYANPQIRNSFINEIAPDVLAVTQGYKESTESIATNRVGDVY